MTELWHTDTPIEKGRDSDVDYAYGGAYLAGRVEVDERAVGGLQAAATAAYAAIRRFTVRSGHRHLLRMYNYFSSINAGDGDAERYKLFCSGRTAGFQGLTDASRPAASALGRQDHSTVLQVYWLAGNEPGRAIENPRQVSAFHYPRQYGPTPPCFSRAMVVSGGLLISGTASVLGHTSRHPDDLPAQLDEILRNLASLRQASGAAALAQVRWRDAAQSLPARRLCRRVRDHLSARAAACPDAVPGARRGHLPARAARGNRRGSRRIVRAAPA